jgi:hypothetical protein
MTELIRFSEHLIMDGYNDAYGIAADLGDNEGHAN